MNAHDKATYVLLVDMGDKLSALLLNAINPTHPWNPARDLRDQIGEARNAIWHAQRLMEATITLKEE